LQSLTNITDLGEEHKKSKSLTTVRNLAVSFLEIYSRGEARRIQARQVVIRKPRILPKAFFFETVFSYNFEFPLRSLLLGVPLRENSRAKLRIAAVHFRIIALCSFALYIYRRGERRHG